MILVEGFFSEIFGTLTGGAFLTGLARLLGAGPLTLACVMALPVLAQLAQCVGPRLQRRLGSYRGLVVRCALTSRCLWLIPALLPLFGLHGQGALTCAMVTVFVMAAVGMVAGHGWTAWMADIVPVAMRARTFGRRTSAVSLATLLVTPAGALLLDHCRGTDAEGLSYALLGGVAVVSGCISGVVLKRLPDAKPCPSSCAHLHEFVAHLPERQSFVRVLAFFALWAMGVGLTAPFWNLYMLETLQMSFLLVCVHDALLLLVRLLVNTWWSRLIERVGTRRVLVVCALVIGLNPLIWLLPTPTNYWPVWVEAVFGGIFWTGFNQAAFIAPMRALAPDERGYGLAVLNLGTGLAQFFASVLGGLVLRTLGGASLHGFATLFMISAVLRILTGVVALRYTETLRLRDVRGWISAEWSRLVTASGASGAS